MRLSFLSQVKLLSIYSVILYLNLVNHSDHVFKSDVFFYFLLVLIFPRGREVVLC